ncbi:ABC transporter ATP-binding protein [Mesorhizobium sp. SEMIA 3007]|uniref:ABC transporter ATP-binding protein n=1 Tax=Mesorhizobium TaxID=68287 RepID=UPI00049AD265|nr:MULTISPECIES: ABC transporter ATP-binding protein [Mesorhizobium]AID30429.1 ATP-binding cassette domain-containing protein [Mesorhizobium huakuii 7653R]MCH4559618.1 ABC transporter ATP-binding protein [Mesorhizobium jarvisii]ODA91884.1 ABC transporter ATP-binding protein [Mesorhizobium sp. SEMIA 3007]
MADLLALEGIRKSYNVGTPVETEVLHGIDVTIHPREFVALMGPSGSGKSTLLNIIGLLDRPTSGRLSIHGEDTTELSEAALTSLRGHTIGFVFQYHYLISAFTARENVMMPMLLDRGRPDAAMERRADELLDWVDLGRWRNNRALNMSGGQQQRVAIARALAMDPLLVLADEPTGNLDTASADAVFELMRRFNRERGTTFLIVTHNHDLAGRCDRIIQVVDGRITEDRINVLERHSQ